MLTLIKTTLLMIVFLFFITVSYLVLACIIDTIDDISFDIHFMIDMHSIKGNIVELLWEIAQVVFYTLIILLVIVVLCESYMLLK